MPARQKKKSPPSSPQLVDLSSHILDSMLDAVVVANLDGTVRLMNRAALELLGYTTAEVTGQPVGRFFAEERKKERKKEVTFFRGTGLAQLVREGAAREVETTLLTRAGERVAVVFNGSVVRDAERRLVAVLGVARDIKQRKQADAALQQYAKRLETLHAIDQAILAAQTPEEIARAALQRLRQLVPCLRASAVLFHLRAREIMVLATQVGGETSLGAGELLPVEAYGRDLEALQQGQVHLVEDVLALSQPPAAVQVLQAEGLRSYVNVPLIVRDELIGALILGAEAPGAFTFESVEIAGEVAASLAVALQQARLFAKSSRRSQQLATVSDIGRRITAMRDFEELMWSLVEHVCRAFNYAHATIFLVEGDHAALPSPLQGSSVAGQVLVSRAAFSLSTGRAPHLVGVRLKIGEQDICGRAARTGQLLLARDLEREPYYHRRPGAPLSARSALAMPLRLRGQVIGVLEVQSDRVDNFDGDNVQLMNALGAHISTAIENARLYEQVWREQSQLEQLSRRIVRAQEDERRRIARELHDEIAQMLTGVKLSLEALTTELPVELTEVRQFVGRSVALVEDTVAQVSDLSLEFRPPILDDIGLLATMEWYIEHFSARTGIAVALDDGGLEAPLQGDVETAVYRIVQEAMTNTARHAAARHVRVSLQIVENGLRVEVEDDGCGFDVDEVLGAEQVGEYKHFGLIGIRERAALFGGQVQIDSSPGQGTRVVVKLPEVISPLSEAR